MRTMYIVRLMDAVDPSPYIDGWMQQMPYRTAMKGRSRYRTVSYSDVRMKEMLDHGVIYG